MKISEFTNNFTKEKESTLSLLRIPLNFFAEGDKPKTDKSSTSNNGSDVNSGTSSVKKTTLSLDPNSKEGSITIDLGDIEFDSKTSSKKNPDTAKPSDSSDEKDSAGENPDEGTPTDESNEQPDKKADEKNEDNENNKELSNEEGSKEVSGSTDPNQPSQSANSPSSDNQVIQPHSPSSPTPDSSESTDTNEKNIGDSTPAEPSQDNSSKKSSSESESKETKSSSESESKAEVSSESESEENKDSSSSSKSKDSDKKSESSKKLDNLKKKFNDKNPVKKAKDKLKEKAKDKANELKDKAKDKLADKAANNPALAKAGGKAAAMAKDAKNIKDAIKDGDQDKMHEAVGDLAVKGAATAGKAINPAIGKGIEVADKVVGNTAIGKKAKKAIGTCCCGGAIFGCITTVIIILLPIIFIMSAFSWITNLFAKKDTSYFGTDAKATEVSEEDLVRIKEASNKYSMQSYTDLTMNLSKKNWLETIFRTKPDFPIQAVTEEYINNHLRYSEAEALDHNRTYKDLIERGLVIEVVKNNLTNEYEQTSFGMAFDILRGNYSPFRLKAPSSAPKRIKYIDGEKKVYTTYNPKDIHIALFQDVLDSKKADEDGTTNKLKVRFDGQVDPKWFDELYDILDKKFDVYISEMNETRKLSLYDIFINTSDSFYDTEYYANLVNNLLTHILTDEFSEEKNCQNNELINQYNLLVDKLAMLELMTYMSSYQNYYYRISNFYDSARGYANREMFNPNTPDGQNFWAQFLTFSNIEHYLALSGLTDPSLAYEIAVVSSIPSSNTIDDSKIESGGKHFIGIKRLQNWFATYEFKPEVNVTSDGFNYILNDPKMTPTQDQKYLFDKYNVYFGLYDYDDDLDPYDPEKNNRNENTFFAMFEAATGVSMSIYEFDGINNAWITKTPEYSLDKKGAMTTLPIDPATSPLARVTTGYNQLYSDDTVQQFGLSHRNHTGIDYGVPTGTTIQAIASGTAYTVPGNTGYGNYVKVVHDDGYTSIYGHGNGTFYVNNGSRVVPGQPIMQSGNSGNSTGPHLHLEVRTPQGSPINPNSYIYQNA